MVSVTRVTNLFHHMSKQVGTLQATVKRSTSQTSDCWRDWGRKKEKRSANGHKKRNCNVSITKNRMRCAMIYDLSKKITYCSAKDINHATSSIQIVASALKKSASKQRDAAL